MSLFNEHAAEKHPAYNDALRQAIKLAAAGTEASVYYDGKGVMVRSAYAPKPDGAAVVCIAQRWDEKTIQLRFSGARSEWVHA